MHLRAGRWGVPGLVVAVACLVATVRVVTGAYGLAGTKRVGDGWQLAGRQQVVRRQ